MPANATGSIGFKIVVKDPQVTQGNQVGAPPKTAVYSTRDKGQDGNRIDIRNTGIPKKTNEE